MRLTVTRGGHFLACIEDGLRGDLTVCGRCGASIFTTDEPNNFAFVVVRRIANKDMEQEAIHLSFRQGIGAFLFDRILGGEDEEKMRQPMRLAGNSDLSFLHRFEQCGLRFGRSAIDFVSENEIAENGAC